MQTLVLTLTLTLTQTLAMRLCSSSRRGAAHAQTAAARRPGPAWRPPSPATDEGLTFLRARAACNRRRSYLVMVRVGDRGLGLGVGLGQHLTEQPRDDEALLQLDERIAARADRVDHLVGLGVRVR
eukprot:scaffold11083_cov55-Phaeocystis_antarctica.AAC.1